MKISLLAVHDATSPRKVDFHFWADVLASRGHTVNFVTVGFSAFTFLKKNGRKYKPPFNRWVSIDFNVRKFLWRPAFHPFALDGGVVDGILSPVFSLYPKLMPASLLDGLLDTDIFIVENGAGLMLVPELSRRNPSAKFIYSVCDRPETLGYHSVILKAEKKALEHVDLVRVPAQVMVADYARHRNVQYIPHGVDKIAFDMETPNPYKAAKNAISVGDMLFDDKTIQTLAINFPDWTFHLFGKNAVLKRPMENVVSYGERPFAEIIPYIQHADIGIAPYCYAPQADYISQSSLKMIQYTYCRLPIVAPQFAAAQAHVMAYVPCDEKSIILAMRQAMALDRNAVSRAHVIDWHGAVDGMLSGVGCSNVSRAL